MYNVLVKKINIDVIRNMNFHNCDLLWVVLVVSSSRPGSSN